MASKCPKYKRTSRRHVKQLAKYTACTVQAAIGTCKHVFFLYPRPLKEGFTLSSNLIFALKCCKRALLRSLHAERIKQIISVKFAKISYLQKWVELRELAR